MRNLRLNQILPIVLLAGCLTAGSTVAATRVWDGGGADNNWGTAANWVGNVAPAFGDDLQFAGTVRPNPFNDFTNTPFTSITFNSGATSFDLQGNTVYVGNGVAGAGGITNDSDSTQTLSFDIANPGFPAENGLYLQNSQTWNAAAGNLVINATDVGINSFVVGGSATLTITGAFDTTINSRIIDDPLNPGPALEIVKDGTGTLTLNNTLNLYTGGTTVNNGTLVIGDFGVLGTFAASNNLTLNGGQVMTPLNAPINYQVYNDFNHNGGTLFMQIGSNVSGTNNDLMLVFGAANLDINNSHLFVHRVPSNQIFAPGDSVTIISTLNGVNGEFSDAPPGSPAPNDFNQLIQPFAVYGPNFVDLQFNFAASFASVAKTPNQFATGQALDAALAAGCIVPATTFLGNQPINTLRHAYDLIAPEELASMYEASFAQGMVTSVNLQRRMDDIRDGAMGFCNEGFAIQDNHGYSKDGKSVASKDVVQPAPGPADTGSRWGAFITGSGELTKVGGEDDNGDHNGYQLNQAGFTMGVDYRVTDNFAIGLSGGYTHTTGELVDNGRLNTDGGRMGLYATYYMDGFYVDAAANGGWNQYDTRRSAYLGQESGSTDGGEFNGMIAAGYDWKKGCWKFGPIASFEYDYVQFNSFTEGDTSLIPLHFPDQNQDAYRSNLGFRIAHQQNMKPGEGISVVPELRAAWRHDFGSGAYAIDSNFVGCDDTFTVHGPWVGHDSAVVNAGLTAYCTERLSAYIFYDGQFGRDNYNNNAISGGFRVAF